MNESGLGDALAGAWGDWMLAMTWQVALFAAIIWCVARLTGKAPAAFRYGLWMLVFVKLILPPTLAVDWSIMTVVSGYVTPALPAISREVSYNLDTLEPEQSFSVPSVAEGGQNEAVTPSPVLTSPMTTNPIPVRVILPNRGVILMGIWAFGALGLFLMSVLKYRRYVKRALLDSMPASPELLAQLDEQAQAYGLRRTFSLVVSRCVNTPVAFGVRRPKILLPQRALDELTPRQIQFLLGHELAHVKRYDEIAGWGVIVLLCLYWFNPVVWLATVYLRRDREMACDDMVVSNTVNDNKEYASTMVRVAEFYDGTAPAVAGFLGLLGVTDNLMFRVRAVLDGKRRRHAGLRAGIVLALLLLFFAPMGMLTVSSQAQQPPSPPPAQTAPDQVTPTPTVPPREALPTEGDRDYREILKEAVDREIQQYYSKAAPDVQEFIRREAEHYGPSGQWLPENTFDKLTPEEREKKIKYLEVVLPNPYRPNDLALAQAGVLKDKRLLPGVMQWARNINKIALAALGRIGDESAIPMLISHLDCDAIVKTEDSDPEKVRMWARASLVRITGQDLGAEKKAWEDWWNDVKKQPAFTRERPSTFMKDPRPDLLAGQEPVAPSPDPKPIGETQISPSSAQSAPVPTPPQSGRQPEALQAAVDREIQQYYSKADPDVQDFMRGTAKNFGRDGLWLPENAFDTLSADEREQKVVYLEGVLKGEYGRHLCEALVQAGALKDKRLLPGIMKASAYQQENFNYDCRPKWMAVAALGRIGDESAVPLLVSLIDHGNKNTQIWARASLVRITGQNLGQEKKAWGDWWNGAKKQPPITEDQLKPWKDQAASSESQQPGAPSAMILEALQAETEREIQQSYAKADPDVQEYIRWTAKNFGRGGLWLPENVFEKYSFEQREKKVTEVEEVLKGEYGRSLCEALGQAGALKDKRLLPGVMKAAAYHQENGDYDCRAKWIAVAALGRIGDESAVPLLVSLIDHGNQNTRMWARASLVRITGQNLGTEKKAWGDWWNGAKKQPAITEEQLKPWKAPDVKTN